MTYLINVCKITCSVISFPGNAEGKYCKIKKKCLTEKLMQKERFEKKPSTQN